MKIRKNKFYNIGKCMTCIKELPKGDDKTST